MAKPPFIELSNGLRIPILYEDRNVIAIDKPQGWMLAPVSWQNTGRNLFAALTSSVNAGDFWARSRNLKFIRFVHRLDADTSGVLLLVKAPGAVPAYTELFEDRKAQKTYLAVINGSPEVQQWKCRLRIAPTAEQAGVMEINNAQGKDAETLFRVIEQRGGRTLVMCWPLTGRTHQIRLHLAAAGHAVEGDALYNRRESPEARTEQAIALRSIRLAYKDPFMAVEVSIGAATDGFAKAHGFDPANPALQDLAPPVDASEHPRARLEDARRAEKEKRDLARLTRHSTQRDFSRATADRPTGEPARGFPRPHPQGGVESRDAALSRRRSAHGRKEDREARTPSWRNRPVRRRADWADSEARNVSPEERRDRWERPGGGRPPNRGYRGKAGQGGGFGRKAPGPGRRFQSGGGAHPADRWSGRQRFDRTQGTDSLERRRLPAHGAKFQTTAKSGLKTGYHPARPAQQQYRRPFRSAEARPDSRRPFGGKQPAGARGAGRRRPFSSRPPRP